ncbi:MAG: alpha-ribazole phosphatase [Clostridiales bacterium]|nr:alpha-ribazole phosphatase [Clostridiales bacterium]
MRIYLVRHGETTLNQAGCYYGRTDVPLSRRGLAQAERLRDFFSEYRFDKIITSPLLRCVMTTETILAGKAGGIYMDERLAEQDFGIFEGHTYEELLGIYPAEVKVWNENYSEYRIPGGESFADVRRRTESFLQDLSGNTETMLLVAHKGTLGHLLAACLELPLEGYWNFAFDQGCYSLIDTEDGYTIIRKLNQSV